MNKIKFKDFLLNENRVYLGEKVGDILNAVHDLDDGSKLGARQMVKFSEKLVAQIRRILHSNWPETEKKHLKALQKVGVAIMNAIEQKDDLKELLPSIRQELEQLSSDLGVPINSLGDQESPDELKPKDAAEGPQKPPEAPQPTGAPEQAGPPPAAAPGPPASPEPMPGPPAGPAM